MTDNKRRKIAFMTGTRADFGKLKPLMLKLRDDPQFDLHVFVTGMHMLSKYGYTCEEIEKVGLPNIHKYINQNSSDSLDHILCKTISGLSDYMKEIRPDLLLVHGDRVEALAGASVAALNHSLVGHIEGGEVSGTVDELIRHAVSKLSHVHFVANESAGTRLLQLGEAADSIHVIGSPEVDIMNSASLPTIDDVRKRYEFDYDRYAIGMFHPVTSEIGDLKRQIRIFVDQVLASGLNYVIIYPNNDPGTEVIVDEYERFKGLQRIRIYPSMRFEYFLTLLKNALFVIGNSSVGVREAPHYGVPSLNLGSRQTNRVTCATVLDVPVEGENVAEAIHKVQGIPRSRSSTFGSGNSAERFHRLLVDPVFWKRKTQKYFVDQVIKCA